MNDIILKVENVSKLYRLGTVGTGTFGGDVQRFWKTKILGHEDPFLKIGQTNDRTSKEKAAFVWALKDINFEVNRGEVLGIIGKNGAGKSTLLKLLSRITSPTTGNIRSAGRMASLLEVGTGFHPELTGRENIYLNGAILGMTKKEIQRKFDEIVDFSGCELYIDTPTKRYSSGMTVRLGFAVAAFLDPEVLIVDEVLAVGDIDFQQKAIGKMKEVSESWGRTVLFVSHNLASIGELCERSLLMANGEISYDGPTIEALKIYNESIKIQQHKEILFTGELTQFLKFEFLNLNGQNSLGQTIAIKPQEDIEVYLKFKCETKNLQLIFAIVLFMDGKRILTINDSDDFSLFKDGQSSKFKIKKRIFRPGNYSIGVGVRTSRNEFTWCESVCNFEIISIWDELMKSKDIGVINADSNICEGVRL